MGESSPYDSLATEVISIARRRDARREKRPETRLRDNTSSRRLLNSPISSGISPETAERLEKREREREKKMTRERMTRENKERGRE